MRNARAVRRLLCAKTYKRMLIYGESGFEFKLITLRLVVITNSRKYRIKSTTKRGVFAVCNGQSDGP
jgi:hypothetical protein